MLLQIGPINSLMNDNWLHGLCWRNNWLQSNVTFNRIMVIRRINLNRLRRGFALAGTLKQIWPVSIVFCYQIFHFYEDMPEIRTPFSLFSKFLRMLNNLRWWSSITGFVGVSSARGCSHSGRIFMVVVYNWSLDSAQRDAYRCTCPLLFTFLGRFRFPLRFDWNAGGMLRLSWQRHSHLH